MPLMMTGIWDASELSMLKTRNRLLPLTVSRFAPGPLMVTPSTMPSSPDVSVMVLTELEKSGANEMMSTVPAPLVLAVLMASRREPKPLSLTLVTNREVGMTANMEKLILEKTLTPMLVRMLPGAMMNA